MVSSIRPPYFIQVRGLGPTLVSILSYFWPVSRTLDYVLETLSCYQFHDKTFIFSTSLYLSFYHVCFKNFVGQQTHPAKFGVHFKSQECTTFELSLIIWQVQILRTYSALIHLGMLEKSLRLSFNVEIPALCIGMYTCTMYMYHIVQEIITSSPQSLEWKHG